MATALSRYEQVVIIVEGVSGVGKSTMIGEVERLYNIKSLKMDYQDILNDLGDSERAAVYANKGKEPQYQTLYGSFLANKQWQFLSKNKEEQLLLLDRCSLSDFFYNALFSLRVFKRPYRVFLQEGNQCSSFLSLSELLQRSDFKELAQCFNFDGFVDRVKEVWQSFFTLHESALNVAIEQQCETLNWATEGRCRRIHFHIGLCDEMYHSTLAHRITHRKTSIGDMLEPVQQFYVILQNIGWKTMMNLIEHYRPLSSAMKIDVIYDTVSSASPFLRYPLELSRTKAPVMICESIDPISCEPTDNKKRTVNFGSASAIDLKILEIKDEPQFLFQKRQWIKCRTNVHLEWPTYALAFENRGWAEKNMIKPFITIHPRSSDQTLVKDGVIDWGYTGDIYICLTQVPAKGSSVGQLILHNCEAINGPFEEEENTVMMRQERGFGSTRV